MYSLYQNPEIFGLYNFAETVINNGMGDDFIKNYVPAMKSLALSTDWRHRSLFNNSLPAIAGCKIIMDRTHIPFGDKWWPTLDGCGLKIISVIRDPREVILSLLRWQGMEKRNINNWPKRKYVANFMDFWHQSVNAYQQLKENNDAVLVRHEDMCAKPEEKGLELYRWLGVVEEAEHFNKTYKEAANRMSKSEEYVKYLTPQIIESAKRIGYDL